ncbi:MAG: hypothetical protein JKY65_01770 [Planctomycetes bacterium]|nr:hypothetical protein [Planctomycetota bacterium]
MARKTTTGDPRLDALAGGGPKRSPNVRALARFAANSDCQLATVGFAARIDFDKLLVGTEFEVPFGQSPFAFRRGDRFEDLLRKNDYDPLLGLFRDHLGFKVSDARVKNLRGGARNRRGMEKRAKQTEDEIRAIIQGSKSAPNLLDGAVLTREIAGVRSYFEADAIAAQFDGPIRAGEVKSFPTVDGQADPDKVGAAVAQVSIYILLLRELVARLGGDPEQAVSDEALIITPKNTGLQPTMCVRPVRAHVERARRILDSTPSATEIADSLPRKLPTFGSIADVSARESKRVDGARKLIEVIGNNYRPSCLAACGLSRMCRHRAHERGDPQVVGGSLERLVPGISSLDRVHKLAAGGRPKKEEAAVAEQLKRAATLRERYAK